MASISITSRVKADSRLYASATLTVTQGSQSIENNATTINYSVSGTQVPTSEMTFTGTARNPAGKIVVKINGSVVKTLNIALLPYDRGTASASGTVSVPHNADGTKTVSYSIEMQEVTGNYSGDTWKYGATSNSGSLALTAIPRSSSISSIANDSMVIDGNNALTVNLSRASSNFTHDITFTFGDYKQSLTGQGASATLTIPLTWIGRFGNGGKGSLTGTVSVQTKNGSTSIGSAVSKEFTLYCPTASSIISSTSSIVCDGSNAIGVSISRSISSFTHTVTWAFGSHTNSKTNQGTSTSYTPPTSWLSAISTTNSGTGSVSVTTYYGSQQIGDTVSKNFTMSVPDYTPGLTSVNVALVQDSKISDWDIYIQFHSKAKFTFNGAAGAYSSTIKEYKVVLDGVAYTSTDTSYTSNAITGKGSLSWTATITDSRGKTNSKSGTIEVYEKIAPTFVSNVIGRYKDGKFDDEGTELYFKFVYAYETYGGLNSTTNKLSYRNVKNNSFLEYGSFENDEIEFVNTVVFDNKESYELLIEVTDELGSTLERRVIIPTASALIDADGPNNALGLLRMANKNDTVQVGGALEVDDIVSVGNTNGSYVKIEPTGRITSNTTSTEDWANACVYCSNEETVAAIGAYARGNNLKYVYVGTKATEPWFTVDQYGNGKFNGKLDVDGKITVEPIGNVLGYQRFDNDWFGLYPTHDDAVANTNRKGWIGHNDSNDLHINNEKNGYIKFVTGGKVLGVAADSNGYVGFSGEGGYVRTPTNGLLPNDSAGNSTIGTEDWRFATGYFKSINVKGAVELLGDTPYIDFHYGNSSSDYTSRLIANGESKLTCTSQFHANGGVTTNLVTNYLGSIAFRNTSNSSFIDFYDTVENAQKLRPSDRRGWFGWDAGSINLYFANAAGGYIGGNKAWTNASDKRLKDNVEELPDVYVDIWKELQPKMFKWNELNSPDGKTHFGLIAQDVMEAFDKYGLSYKDYGIIGEFKLQGGDGTEYYAITYDHYHMMTAAVVKQQQKEIDNLKSEVAELKELVQQLLK